MDFEQQESADQSWPQSKEFWSGAGGEVDECSLLLRFFGDDLDPGQISEMLGTQPSTAHKKGDKVPRRSQTFTAPTGFWSLDCEETSDTADNEVAQLFSRLNNDLTVWEKIAARVRGEIKCHLFLRRWTRGTIFSAHTLESIAKRKLALHIEIYSRWQYSPYSKRLPADS